MAPNPTDGRSTRREVIQAFGMGAVGIGAAGFDTDAIFAGNEDALDEAYRLLRGNEPATSRGLSDHAPMVAEALCSLGEVERSVKWVRDHLGTVVPNPPVRAPIDPNKWQAALGPVPGATSWDAANARWADWREYFASELAKSRWQDVLDRWVGRLAPGLSGAATHGVIRTAHVVRALGRRETPERKIELARAMAYWASSYEQLPARQYKGRRYDSFARALAEVPTYIDAFGKRPEGGIIVEALRHVKELERFSDVKGMISDPPDIGKAISALTATFARVFLRHGTRHDTIAFVHAVTGPCSLRRLAPHIQPGTARAALPYAWQAAAAIYCAYGRKSDDPRPEESRLTPAELSARAVADGDAHAIKFTEVMLAEHRINPDPVYLAAAEEALKRL